MAQKPPAWTRFGQIGQVPLALSRDVDTTGVHPSSGQEAHTLAEQIVRDQQPIINRFVAKQRQQIEIGALDVHTAVLLLDGMDVHYSHVQGLERMHYHISPQAKAPEVPEPSVEVKPEEAPKKPELGQPDFLTIDIPCFLAIEFGDGAT